jgi:hypothetical protein
MGVGVGRGPGAAQKQPPRGGGGTDPLALASLLLLLLIPGIHWDVPRAPTRHTAWGTGLIRFTITTHYRSITTYRALPPLTSSWQRAAGDAQCAADSAQSQQLATGSAS